MKNLFRAALFLAAFASAAIAAEPVDLGQGLGYLRVHSLADDQASIAQATHTTRALVLDLRYATANDESAAALRTALANRAPGTPLFVLVSPATPPAVANAAAGELTLGPVGTAPAPKVIVHTVAATDRRAFDAHESGLALDALITGKIEKERYDEASLMKDFKNGNTAAEPPPGPDPTKPGAPEKVPTLTDSVLQRAVHLHRALLALRRPPAKP
jgi:hypothetical protein